MDLESTDNDGLLCERKVTLMPFPVNATVASSCSPSNFTPSHVNKDCFLSRGASKWSVSIALSIIHKSDRGRGPVGCRKSCSPHIPP